MCAGLPGRRSFGPGLIFLLLFASRQKVDKSILGKQKKEKQELLVQAKRT
jgi:hypothetical protein